MSKSSKKITATNNTFKEMIIYSTPEGGVKVEIFLKDENIWLTQKLIAKLFDCSSDNVSLHFRNIFKDGELLESSVTEEFSVTADDGKNYIIKHYNLDAIIAVGYRVNSARATQFRIWATEILKEYIIKGFAMNDERLKDPSYVFGKDYFEEQLARIRNIRSSERRLYQKITDIYAECSADYDPKTDITHKFYATVQNKLHYAIAGQTAAEIIHKRIDSSKPNMGLTNWKNGPRGKIRESDVIIAKNYLNEIELDHLNRIVTMYLDYAEIQAKRGVIMFMKDWVKKLDAFLKFNEEEILLHAGKISHEVAEELALKEFGEFRVKQDRDYISDFDREVKEFLKEKKNND